jgi:hypothetical protein
LVTVAGLISPEGSISIRRNTQRMIKPIASTPQSLATISDSD